MKTQGAGSKWATQSRGRGSSGSYPQRKSGSGELVAPYTTLTPTYTMLSFIKVQCACGEFVVFFYKNVGTMSFAMAHGAIF
jgi:hypothetical protein